MWQLNHVKELKRPNNARHATVANVPTHQTTIEMCGSATSAKDNVITFEEPYLVSGKEAVFFDLRYINGSLSQASILIEGYHRDAQSRPNEPRKSMPHSTRHDLKQQYKYNKTVKHRNKRKVYGRTR